MDDEQLEIVLVVAGAKSCVTCPFRVLSLLSSFRFLTAFVVTETPAPF